MDKRLAILGCGKIGEILLSGLLESRWATSEEIVVTARRPERVADLKRLHGVECLTSNSAAAASASTIVIAVKPQDMEALLTELEGVAGEGHLIVSVAAAISTTFIEKRLPGVAVVRAMPNAPSQVREGIAGICAGSRAGDGHLAIAEELLAHVGRVVRVAEPYMDAVTAVSGSGPAYFALLAEAMIDAGIMLGLSRVVSTDLVVQTMLGTATLLRDAPMHPFELREAVTSPGGTTIMAVRELEQAGVRAALLNAIQAAMERSRELSEGHD